MRIHTNTLTADDILAGLTNCKAAGLIAPAVTIDVLTAHGSRSHERALEMSMGTPSGTPSFLADDAKMQLEAELTYWDAEPAKIKRVLKRAAMRRSRNGYGTANPDFPLGATWHEWGYLLGALFNADPDLKVAGIYEDRETFYERTMGVRIPGEVMADPTFGDAGAGRMAVDFLNSTRDLAPAIAA